MMAVTAQARHPSTDQLAAMVAEHGVCSKAPSLDPWFNVGPRDRTTPRRLCHGCLVQAECFISRAEQEAKVLFYQGRHAAGRLEGVAGGLPASARHAAVTAFLKSMYAQAQAKSQGAR